MYMWHYLIGSAIKKPVPAWGPDQYSTPAILVLVQDNQIVAAIDERYDPQESWEAVYDWGNFQIPLSFNWRSTSYGPFVSPL